MTPDRFTIYRDFVGRWRWRCVAGNGKVLADSGQGYSRRIDCVRGLEIVCGDKVQIDYSERSMSPTRYADGFYCQGRLATRRTFVEVLP